jgi:hypothetical protein
MLGGVGFQVGLDEARRAAARAARPPAAPSDVIEQLKALKALRDDGALSPEEFQLAKQKVLVP